MPYRDTLGATGDRRFAKKEEPVNKTNNLIELWEEKIGIIENLITFHKCDDVMLGIMIARKNQLIECIEDFKKALLL